MQDEEGKKTMKVWIIFVKAKWNGVLVFRYIDSQWASKKAAQERRAELDASLQAFGGRIGGENGAETVMVEGSVADAAITNPVEEKNATE